MRVDLNESHHQSLPPEKEETLQELALFFLGSHAGPGVIIIMGPWLTLDDPRYLAKRLMLFW